MAGLDPAIRVLLGAIRKDVDARDKRGHDGSTGFAMRRQNIFADLGLPTPEQELLKAKLTLQIYSIVKERKAAYRVSHRARPGRADHGEADTEGEGEMKVVAG
jgi:hypothetical protein